MMNQAERRAFVADHRTCIFGFQRKHGPPSMSVVYYVMDGDDILISTMAERAKARAVRRTHEAAICVLDEQWPLTYLQVYGPADVEDALEEMLLLSLANANPALAAYRELFDDSELRRTSAYPAVISSLQAFFATEPGFTPGGESLFDALMAPARRAPHSLQAQLEYLLERWGAKLKVLQESIQHHIEEEEGKMFRTARAVFSRDELRALGVRMAQMKADAQGKEGRRS